MFYSQTINNACGLYALLHAICNTSAKELVSTSYCYQCSGSHKTDIPIAEPDSILASLIDRSRLDPLNRTKLVYDSEQIREAYNKAALRGRTDAPPATEEVECHYVCFTKTLDTLWLWDGDRDGPMKSDKQLRSDEDILEGAGLEAIKGFLKNFSNTYNLGIMALVPT